ncbi:glycosyltransferase family 4 protein, partial [Photobacterium sanctipauli]
PKSALTEKVSSLGCKVYPTSHFLFSHNREITQDCQAIHVHEGRSLYWAMIQSLLTKCPYIVTRRIDNPLRNRWLLKKGYEKAGATIGLSQSIVNRIKDKLPASTPYRIPSSPVTYPVNKSQVEEIKAQYQDKFVIIQAANIVAYKGFEVTIEAAKCLQKQYPNIQFVFLGDGNLREELENKTKHLSNVHFVGKQRNMGDWFTVADMQVHTSYSEGLGSVILEGMNAGLPVIATKTGGIPDIIDDKKNGELIEVGNHQQLSNAIIKLYESPELRKQYITAGKEKMANFAISNTAQQYEEIYRSL